MSEYIQESVEQYYSIELAILNQTSHSASVTQHIKTAHPDLDDEAPKIHIFKPGRSQITYQNTLSFIMELSNIHLKQTTCTGQIQPISLQSFLKENPHKGRYSIKITNKDNQCMVSTEFIPTP